MFFTYFILIFLFFLKSSTSVKVYDCLGVNGHNENSVQSFLADGCQPKRKFTSTSSSVNKNDNNRDGGFDIGRALVLLEEEINDQSKPNNQPQQLDDPYPACYWPIESHLGWLGVNYNLTLSASLTSTMSYTIIIATADDDSRGLVSKKMTSKHQSEHEDTFVMKTFSPIVSSVAGQSIKHNDMFVLVTSRLKFEWNRMVNIKHVIHDGHSHQPVVCFQYKAFIFLEDQCNKKEIKSLIRKSGAKLAKLGRLNAELRSKQNLLTMALEQKILSLTMLRVELKKIYPKNQPCRMFFDLKRLYNRLKYQHLPKIIALSQQVDMNQSQMPIIDFGRKFIDGLQERHKIYVRDKNMNKIIMLSSQIKTLQDQLDRLKKLDSKSLQAQITVESIFNLIEILEIQ